MIDGKKIPVTLSGGVADLRSADDLEAAASIADAGLYIAKKSGKNGIEWAREDSEPKSFSAEKSDLGF